MFLANTDQAAASESYSGAYGSVVVTEQAVAAGVASIPTPVTDDTSDWFQLLQFAGRFRFLSGIGFEDSNSWREFDSKAMRKVDFGSTAVEVLETSALSSGVLVVSYVRNLIKLH